MRLRIAENAVRLRLEPDDLAALGEGRTVAVGFAAPDCAGGMGEFRCELALAASSGPDVVLGAGSLRVALGSDELESLRDEACEGVTLTMESDEGRPLEVVVEKDRRAFPVRSGAPRVRERGPGPAAEG